MASGTIVMKKILVCPLDWGLGHATRCIPVIGELQKKRAEIIIASSGEALQLLRQEFPELAFFELPSYRPVYPEIKSMLFEMLTQLPRFMRVIKEEHAVTEKIVREQKIDLVISDNRYGCWSAIVKSVFITHQLKILMPRGMGWASPGINFLNRRCIQKFGNVWIPDQPGSGLTTPFISKHVPNQSYIGWLSRFQARNEIEQKYEIIALVSGPEPQRTIFQKIMLTQLLKNNLKSLLVAGEPGKPYHKQEGCVEIVNHLPSRDLEQAILSSRIVISRSGYSTVMDLIALGKKAVFIPTPQQPEQIFFARYFKENHIAFSEDQPKFSVSLALEKSDEFKGFGHFKMEDRYLVNAIESILE